MYPTASIITEQIALKPTKREVGKRDTTTWKAKLKKEIKRKRNDLSILTEIAKGSTLREEKRIKLRNAFT